MIMIPKSPAGETAVLEEILSFMDEQSPMPVFRDIKAFDMAGNNHRVNRLPDFEDEFDAIFDIIDDFNISVEEGLEFFARASEWLTLRAKEVDEVLDLRPGRFGGGRRLREERLPLVGAGVDWASMAVKERVAPEDYLQGEFHEMNVGFQADIGGSPEAQFQEALSLFVVKCFLRCFFACVACVTLLHLGRFLDPRFLVLNIFDFD
jgi:hypothetical protein